MSKGAFTGARLHDYDYATTKFGLESSAFLSQHFCFLSMKNQDLVREAEVDTVGTDWVSWVYISNDASHEGTEYALRTP